LTNQITSNLHTMNTISSTYHFSSHMYQFSPPENADGTFLQNVRTKHPTQYSNPKWNHQMKLLREQASLWNINCRSHDFAAMTLAWTVQDIGFRSAKPDSLWFIHFNKCQQLLSTDCIIPISDENCFQIQHMKNERSQNCMQNEARSAYSKHLKCFVRCSPVSKPLFKKNTFTKLQHNLHLSYVCLQTFGLSLVLQ
jgi:hypothetical protein